MCTKRIISVFCLAFLFLALGFSSSMAVEKIYVNYGPYTVDGQSPYAGTVVSWQQIYDHLTILAPFTHWVRIFTCRNGLENVGPIAHSFGIGVAAGCWLSGNIIENATELQALIDVCQRGDADIAIIGSETLYRNDLTAIQLLGYINQFKSAVPGFPVAVADTYGALSANPDVVSAGDVVMANSYPYWEGIDIVNAVSYLRKSYLDLKEQFPDSLIVIGETGWPSEGRSIGLAVPSPAHAAWYFWGVESWSKAEDVIVFYFEAFDEPWKADYEGSQGSHWGLFDQYGVLKPYMKLGFSKFVLPAQYWE